MVKFLHSSNRHCFNRSSRKAASIALLVSLMLGSGAMATQQAIALSTSNSSSLELAQATERPARQLTNRVRRLLARELGVSRKTLSIASYTQETWSDGCLGLGGPAESCLASLVEGWRIEVTDGEQSWFYRTDETGMAIRQEPQATAELPQTELPQSVIDQVLAAASQESNLPVDQLRITQADAQIWNGCLGIQPPDMVCTEIAIYGWRVVVSNNDQSWVYHTNDDGSDVRLNAIANQFEDSTLTPILLGNNEIPPALHNSVVFRVMASGGIADQMYSTTLMRDGRVIQILVGLDGTFSNPQVHEISRQQVEAFEELLQDQQFSNFHRLHYLARPGSADYMTVTLTHGSYTTQFADSIQDQLPAALKQVLQSWNQIASDNV